MTHRREEIRDAVVVLLTGGSVIGTNVTSMNPYLKNSAEIPGVNVITGEEILEEDSSAMDNTEVRYLNLYVDIFSNGLVSDSADTLDDIAEEVENAIKADRKLGGLIMQIYYKGVDEAEISSEGEDVLIYQRMNYLVVYDW